MQGRVIGLGEDPDEAGEIVEQLLDAVEDSGAVEPAVSVGDGWASITAYYYAADAEEAVNKLRALGVQDVEVL